MSDFGAYVAQWVEHWTRLADPARIVVADATGIGPGTRLLDLGCGSGDFARLAAARGAQVVGIDAAPEMIAVARERSPGAELSVGDMTGLPWADDQFDVVTAFNSMQFTHDPAVPIVEAARVLRPGGRLAICNWGRAGEQDLDVPTDALEALLPEPRPRRRVAVGESGVLESLVRDAGLTVDRAGDVDLPYEVPDDATLLRAHELDVGLLDLARYADADTIATTILAASAPFRRPDGSYRFANRWRYVVAA